MAFGAGNGALFTWESSLSFPGFRHPGVMQISPIAWVAGNSMDPRPVRAVGGGPSVPCRRLHRDASACRPRLGSSHGLGLGEFMKGDW
jgi:hypothetical protein